MKNWIASHHRIIFFTAWLLLGIWQSVNTDLLDDEAYYWVYSMYPDWGYFEHPPLVSWISRAGYAIIPNETGLRLLFLILNTVSLILLQSLTSKKDELLYYGIIASISLLHLAGHLAVPDSPLVFASVCFLIFFKRYIANSNLINSILLALAIAFALYSKYHAILWVIICFGANPGLLVRSRTWFAFMVVIILMLPHLFWLNENGFSGVTHHLQERHFDDWRPSFTLQFLQSQLITTGPITGWLLLIAAFKQRTADEFGRTLKWLMTGIFLFFLSLSFFVRVESNWTVLAFIPMILLSHQFLQNHMVMRRWLFIALPVSLVFIFIQRISMTSANDTLQRLSRKELHGNRAFAGRIEAAAGDKPVIFIDSYQQASKYWFYSGNSSFSLNTADHFRNSFNLWPIEANMIGKTVCVADSQLNKISRIRLNENYYSFSGIFFAVKKIHRKGNTVELRCTVNINEELLPFIDQHQFGHLPVHLAAYGHNGKLLALIPTNTKVGQLLTNSSQMVLIKNQLLPIHAVRYRFSIKTSVEKIYTCNSAYFTIR